MPSIQSHGDGGVGFRVDASTTTFPSEHDISKVSIEIILLFII